MFFCISITGIADFEEIWIFLLKSAVRASPDCDRFGFVTFFHASFNVKRFLFALMMLNFVIVVWASEFNL